MVRIIEGELDQKTFSNNEKRIVHILTSCDDVLRYFVLNLRGHSNPFSYKLSKDERSLLRAITKKDADEREAERQRVEARRVDFEALIRATIAHLELRNETNH